MKRDGWYPDEWFAFLAFGAPSKSSSPCLYIGRIITEELPAAFINSTKRKFR